MCDLVKHCIDEFMHCFLGQVRRENGDRLLMVVLVVLLLVIWMHIHAAVLQCKEKSI